MPRSIEMPLALALAAATLGGCAIQADTSPDEGGSPPLVIEVDDGDEARGAPTFPSTATKNTIRIAGDDPAANAAGAATAAFPATSEATRPDSVALVDDDNWQGAVAGSVLTAGKVGAPLLLSDEDELPPITASALARLDPSGSDLAENAQVIRIGDDVARPDGRRTAVIGGGDQYELAAAIDRFSATAEGSRSASVIVASGERPEWATPAGAWAARSGDAVLFTERESLPEPTRTAIEAHERPDIYVLGPEEVIADGVFEELRDLGNVQRIDGGTPVENAVEFARYQSNNFGWGLVTPGHTFTLASTARPLDAAAAAVLGTEGTFAPLLLTDDPTALPDPLVQYFLDIQPGFENNPNTGVFNRVIILGDQQFVSVAEQARIDELTQLIPVQIEEKPTRDPARQGGGGGNAGAGGAPGGSGAGRAEREGIDRGSGGGSGGGGSGGGGGPTQ